MVPDEFHDFFVATAGVAGALIGLLFVALSVAQESGADRAPIQQVRAAAAMSALIDALLISLFALLPASDLSTACIVLGIVGLSSTAGLVVVLHRARLQGRHPRQWLLLFGLLILYVIQLLLATRVDGKVADPDAVNNVGVLVIVFFAIGIARAWELVGAPETGLIGTLRQLRSRPGDDEQP